MNYNIFKSNNYVEYYGRLTYNYKRVGVITSIDRLNDEDTFELTLRKRYPMDAESQIRAYLGEIRPIWLTGDFLKKNNFHFNEQTRLYKRDDVVIYQPFFRHTVHLFGNQSLYWNNKGFRVLHSVIKDFSNESEILEKTASVHSVNALQNYFELVLKKSFEVKLD